MSTENNIENLKIELDNNTLAAYVENRLSAEEKLQVDTLLLSDPFAQEALEGFQLTKSQNAISKSLSELESKIKARSGFLPKKNKSISFHWSNFAYAAVVIGVLIGLGFIMVNFLGNTKGEIAENKVQAESATEEVAAAEQSTESVQDSQAIIIQNTTSSDTLLTNQLVNTDSENKDQNLQQGMMSEATVAESNIKDVIAMSKETKSKVTANVEPSMTNSNLPTQRADEVSKEKVVAERSNYSVQKAEAVSAAGMVKAVEPDTRSPLENAKRVYNEGNFKEAENKFNEVLNQNPDNSEALYYGGVSSYMNGNTKQAEQNFDKLIQQKKYEDGAKWYKANILLQKGKKAKAKDLLRELTNANGYYKEQAVKKIEELK